ncbi:hypothetical protein KHA94_13570 [Bacillus sp. FJAT-49705]|uniref:Uncharacterized protein n=1 Tax=Cytobacillus citreus TaxID=2833586 RepID=A0ABS5NTT9_9BACI|nr:hypothetical protein [Cytobacillus citreus]MBS4191212.1 hypothetical protein [Cytobacillus citreus]
MTTNTINLPNYKTIYSILVRDRDLSFKAAIHFNGEVNHEAIVKWASKEYPAEYKEALSIASNPNRQTVTLWKDELDWFVDEKERIDWERDGLSTLIYDFVFTHKLESQFYSFLQKLMKEDTDGIYGDLEHIARDYA